MWQPKNEKKGIGSNRCPLGSSQNGKQVEKIPYQKNSHDAHCHEYPQQPGLDCLAQHHHGGQAQGGYNAGQGQQGGYQQVQGYGQPAPLQAQGPVNGATQGAVGNAAQGPAYAQPQYQQGGYQPVRQPTPQPVQQPGFQQQPIQQPQQQAPVNPIEVAAADMPQDDLPF